MALGPNLTSLVPSGSAPTGPTLLTPFLILLWWPQTLSLLTFAQPKFYPAIASASSLGKLLFILYDSNSHVKLSPEFVSVLGAPWALSQYLGALSVCLSSSPDERVLCKSD